jgi:BlaI family transcriptional regulator, penicillinase repressor
MVKRKNVPAAELEVLASLQKLGQATAREIREYMHGYRPMTHGAVVNLIKRLEAKRLVTRKKGPVGKAFLYQSTQASRSIYHTVLGRLVNRVFAGDSLAMVASLFETKPPDGKELGRLEELLNELKEKHARKE